MKRDNTRTVIDRKRLIKAVVFGVTAGLAVSLLVLLITAAVIVKSGRVPYPALVPAAIAAACIGAFSGGYTTARINRSFGLATGAFCGVIMYPVLLALGAAFGGSFDPLSLLRLLLMTVSGAVGGVLGVNKRRKRR